MIVLTARFALACSMEGMHRAWTGAGSRLEDIGIIYLELTLVYSRVVYSRVGVMVERLTLLA